MQSSYSFGGIFQLGAPPIDGGGPVRKEIDSIDSRQKLPLPRGENVPSDGPASRRTEASRLQNGPDGCPQPYRPHPSRPYRATLRCGVRNGSANNAQGCYGGSTDK